MKIENLVESIFKKKEEDFLKSSKRTHLGASQIGKFCDREIYYGLHSTTNVPKEGRMLRLFETGNQQEYRIALELKQLGIEVMIEVDNIHIKNMLLESGIRAGLKGELSEMHFEDGNFKGSLDMLTRGWEENKEELFNTEIKTFSNKKFDLFKASGVKTSNYVYYVQAQMYMGFKNLNRTILIGVNKDTDNIHSEVIHLDLDVFNLFRDRAKSILNMTITPERPSAFTGECYWDAHNVRGCKYCDYKQKCWSEK